MPNRTVSELRPIMERRPEHIPPSERIRRALEVRQKLFKRCGGTQYMPTLISWFPELDGDDLDRVNLRMELRDTMRGKPRTRAWPYVVRIEEKLKEATPR